MDQWNTLYLAVGVALGLVAAAALAAHYGMADEEQRVQALYCELATTRAWPVDPRIYCEGEN